MFELMDMNIYELIRGRRQYVAEDKILHFMYQLVKSMDHMHRNGVSLVLSYRCPRFSEERFRIGNSQWSKMT